MYDIKRGWFLNVALQIQPGSEIGRPGQKERYTPKEKGQEWE